MKIWIYPQDGSSPSNYFELTDYIQDITEQRRSDDAFAITTFNILIPDTLFTNAKFNIPPFTIFEIATTNTQPKVVGNKRYFGYSKCKKYLRPQGSSNYYFHEITLIEPLAILEAIQIGAKTFTNHTDREYINILSDIAFNESLIRVNFSGLPVLQSEARAYSFDKGSTMFSIASEIYKINNKKMACVFHDVTEEDVYDELVFDVSVVSTSSQSVNQNALTLVEFSQKQDDYCKCLESQVDNVIDRNTTTTYSDLTCRSDDNYCDNDNAYIELPVKVESVEKLLVKGEYTVSGTITVSEEEATALYTAFPDVELSWMTVCNYVTWLSDFANDIKQTHPNFNPNLYTYFCAQPVQGSGSSHITIYDAPQHITSFLDISDKCLEESIYQALSPQRQTQYCYYRTGDNKIRGIYEYYKDNLIYMALNIARKPMLESLDDSLDFEETSTHVVHTDQYGTVYGKVVMNYTMIDKGANDVTWEVKAHPICNQYVEDVKTDTPINANGYGYHQISRSYGNSANFIDYDIMRKNISISNKSLGTPELTLQFLNECELTNNCSFFYDGKTWYVMSIIMEIFRDKILYTVNATTHYDKQADCIGVRTQFEATRIALDHIKERHLYYDDTRSKILVNNKTYYLYVEFSYANTNRNHETFVLPLNLFYSSTSGLTAVATMVDNYSAGKHITVAKNETAGVTKLVQRDASYVDENGEVKTIEDMKIVTFNGMSIDESRGLPYLPNTTQPDEIITGLADEQTIYKDEHEQLVFTIYLPNATLV